MTPTSDPFESALAEAVSKSTDDLGAQIRAALQIPEPKEAEDDVPSAASPIALNDDAALARIIGGTLNNEPKENA